MPAAPARLKRIALNVETWFAHHQRPLPWRRTYDPYAVWVSEVMLQQTRMEVVLGGYYDRFLSRFPDVTTLAAATDEQVLALWSGLGYYRRARMLRDGARDVMERFSGTIPKDVDELLTIAGIGRYTAGAISSIAQNEHAPIVDGNVARIVSRLEALEAPLGSPALMREAWTRAEQLVAACSEPRHFNQGLMELGALICKPAKPLCMLCPLQGDCRAFATQRVDELPRPKAKRAATELRIPLYLITDAAGRVLMRRESGQLMNAMFHLPHGEAHLFADPLDAITISLLGTFRHTVTTRRIEFALWSATLRPGLRDRGDYAWIDLSGLDAVPHPSYVKKALRLARAKSALAPTGS